MDILQLKYFLEVASQEHMTNAAKKMNISQPTISQAITRLEDELGTKLFTRQGRNIKLNVYGQAILEPITNAIALLDSIKQITETTKETEEAPIVVGYWKNSSMVPRLLSDFARNYPYIKTKTCSDKDKCDFIFSFETFGKLPYPCQILLQEDLCLAVPLSNPLSQKDTVCLSDVANEEFICISKGALFREKCDEFCQLAGFTPNVVMEHENYWTIEQLLNLGEGTVSFWPRYSWLVNSSPKKFKLLSITSPMCVRTIYVTWPENAVTSKSKEIFKSFCIEFFKAMKANSGKNG